MRFQEERYSNILKGDQSSRKLKLGEKVLIYKPTMHNQKHYTWWSGPLVVSKIVEENTYELKDTKTKKTYLRKIKRIRPLTIKNSKLQ